MKTIKRLLLAILMIEMFSLSVFIWAYEPPVSECMAEDLTIVPCNKGEATQISENMCPYPQSIQE